MGIVISVNRNSFSKNQFSVLIAISLPKSISNNDNRNTCLIARRPGPKAGCALACAWKLFWALTFLVLFASRQKVQHIKIC